MKRFLLWKMLFGEGNDSEIVSWGFNNKKWVWGLGLKNDWRRITVDEKY